MWGRRSRVLGECIVKTMGGVCPRGGVFAYMLSAQGEVSALGGFCPGVCAYGGVSAQGGVHLPPVDRQTPVKT